MSYMLSNKTTPLYVKMWEVVLSKDPNRDLETITMDFESASIKAEANNAGNYRERIRLPQLLWRHVQSLGLR